MLGCSLLLGAAGCTDSFEDFNTNPKSPTMDQAQGDFAYTSTLIGNMIPIVALGQENAYQMNDQMIGCEFGRMTAASNMWGQDGMFGTYNPRLNWQGYLFNDLMPNYMYTPFFKIRDASESKGLVYHLANMLRIFGTVRVSDCYGPTPFSMVGGGGSFQVAYDDMPDLYNAMFEEIDNAINGLKEAADANGEEIFGENDPIYSGNVEKWTKFANTLKLRMAMRLVNVNPTLAKQKAEECVLDPAGLIESPADAAWSSFIPGGNALHKVTVLWDEGAVSADITSYMNGYNDPRLPLYVKPASDGSYTGVRNGVYRYSDVKGNNFSAYSKTIYGSTDKLLALTASESWFCRAEGALRGWNMGGTAKELYEKGVTVSMEERGAAIGNYLSSTATPAKYEALDNPSYSSNPTSTVTPAYDENASFETNLERIIVQKWLGNFPNGWESWADFRRTGYPKWFPVVNNLANDGVTAAGGMRRLPYPQSEYNTNSANINEAVKMLGGPDNSATNLWWAKKD